MTTIKIKRGKKGTPPLEFNYAFGKNLAEMRAVLIDEDLIYTAALSTFRAQLADHVRRLLAKKKNAPTPEQIQDQLTSGEWTPGARRRGKSAADKIAKLAASLTDADRAKLVASLSGPSVSMNTPIPIDSTNKAVRYPHTEPREPDDVEKAS